MKPQLIIYHPIIAELTNKDIQQYLIKKDPLLFILFKTIGPDLFTGLPKPPYVALIGAVIGQIVRYTKAKSIRSKLYEVCGNNFSPDTITNLTVKDWNYIGLNLDKIEIILQINQYLSLLFKDLITCLL